MSDEVQIMPPDDTIPPAENSEKPDDSNVVQDVDHDQLFKQLISTFFREFMELFFSKEAAKINFPATTTMDKEVFTDIVPGDKHEVDLLRLVEYEGTPTKIVVHIEVQSSVKDHRFGERMFDYFARLKANHKEPIFPIVVFSFDKPERKELDTYVINVMDFEVNRFNFKVVQLNQLDWHDYVNRQNPVATAMMAKMKIAPEDRPRVKLECLRLLLGLELDPARTALISGFVGTYLRLNEQEEVEFEQGLEELGMNNKKELPIIRTDWEIKAERKTLVNMALLQLDRKIGQIPIAAEEQIRQLETPQLEKLVGDLLDFTSVAQLEEWLQQNQPLVAK
jgi:hypothetical protein